MSRTGHLVYGTMLVTILSFHVMSTARQTAGVPEAFQSALVRHTGNHANVTWLGAPIWQSVLDVWILQEALSEVRPGLLIECGTFRGGSSLYFAHLFDLMDHGRVMTVDIERQHDLSHPRVTYLIGDCAGQDVVSLVRAEAAKTAGPVMVVLDSDHSQAHVAREMEAYAPLVTPGSYLHVQDGVIDTLPLFADSRPGPLRAIDAFLGQHPEFEVDTARSEKFLITQHPRGWLRRRPVI